VSLVHYATVLDTNDPLGLGRVQVSLKGFAAKVDLKDVWLRMVVPYASKQFGFTFLPEVGDEVAVLRGAGDTVESMLVVGALYNGANKPKLGAQDGKNLVKEIRTKGGNTITLSDDAGKEYVLISTAEAKITVKLDNDQSGVVTITGADKVAIDSKTSLTIDSKDIKITASGTLDLGGSTEVKVGSGKFTVSGSDLSLTGSGKVAIVGSTINLG
jgi:uncharacterized protein involved in type VI secretion and phage assembly